jgi:transcriptional regulator with XRE-family HTH domain
MSDLAKQLGRRVYLFRKQNGFTQAALAEKAKISNEFMSGIERGSKLPSLPTLQRLAAALRVNLRDLFNFDQGSFRRVEPYTRTTLELASSLDKTSPEQRRLISKIIKLIIASAEK